MKLFFQSKKKGNNSSSNAFLLVGLGNPGGEHKNNRHNIGFMVVDEIATSIGEKFSRMQSESLVTKGFSEGYQIILAKPRTYMNLSGRAVASLMRFYKLPLENLLVIYDEVDLPSNSIRLKPDGGSAGHKGMKSIIDRLGSQDFSRLRVGIGRPQGKMGTPSHVLQNFSANELVELPITISRAVDAAFSFVHDGIENAMNQYNRNTE